MGYDLVCRVHRPLSHQPLWAFCNAALLSASVFGFLDLGIGAIFLSPPNSAPSPTGVENGLEAGEDSWPNPPSAGDGSAWAWLNGLAEVALLGCEKEKPPPLF